MPEPAEIVRLVPEGHEDPQVQAAKILAAAVDRAIDRFGPAADGIAHLADAQKLLCSFLVRHRLKLALSVPVILTAVGAISPNAATSLHTLIVGLSAHP